VFEIYIWMHLTSVANVYSVVLLELAEALQ